MENGYKHGLQIDRIDNYKGYYPENCRFTSGSQNSRNRESNSVHKINGRLYLMDDLPYLIGMSYHRISYRIRKKKMTAQQIYDAARSTHT
jgi:hypothetical protein